jgi:hypothetical protein
MGPNFIPSKWVCTTKVIRTFVEECKPSPMCFDIGSLAIRMLRNMGKDFYCCMLWLGTQTGLTKDGGRMVDGITIFPLL